MLKTYQKNMWVILNKTELFITMRLRRKILRMFRSRRDVKARRIILILFVIFMLGIDMLRMKSR